MFACLYSPSPERHADLERVARDFSPRVEVRPGGVVCIDLNGLDRLIGPARVIADELSIALAQNPGDRNVSVAMARTRTAAQLLARAMRGVTIAEPGTEGTAIAPLPAAALGALGASVELLDTLDRWGIRTLGQFAVLPSPALSARLGQAGLACQRLARGEDPQPLVPTHAEERFEEVCDLEWPIEGLEPLAFVLARLLDPICARLEARDRGVAALTLRLRVAVSRTWEDRRLELPVPMRDVPVLRTLIGLALEGHPPEGAIDQLALIIEPTPARICQFSLLARPTLAPEQAATLVARLRALMGQDRCGVARLVDTHRPGAFAMGDFFPASSYGGGSTFGSGSGTMTPDLKVGPTYRQSVRRLRQPIPARVVTEAGRPVRVVTDRRGWPGGRVVWCAGPWRSSGDWWTPTPWHHQEWDVALTDGATYRVFEDRQPSAAEAEASPAPRRWFIEAIVD